MKLVKIVVSMGYIVDADNPVMIEDAKEALYEDLMNAVKYDELHNHIEVIDAPDAKEEDIPEFLLENQEDEEDWAE